MDDTLRILVTGANKGIGRALVERVLETKPAVHVLLGSRDLGRGREARDELLVRVPGCGDRLDVVVLDVTDEGSVTDAARWVAGRFDHTPTPLYAIVNNAGISQHAGDLAQVLDVNVWGIHRVCTAFVPLLHPTRGRIVNTTSAAGPIFVAGCAPERQSALVDPDVSWDWIVAFMEECLSIEGGADAFRARGLGDGQSYRLSKACANALTLYLARVHAHLRVNACTPGWIETDMTRAMAEDAGKSPRELGLKMPAEGTRAARFLLFGEPVSFGRGIRLQPEVAGQ